MPQSELPLSRIRTPSAVLVAAQAAHSLVGIERFDTIRLVMPDRVLEYGVVDVRVVRPSQVEVLDPTALPSLTLVTCYPFEYVGSAPYRYVVRAEELRHE